MHSKILSAVTLVLLVGCASTPKTHIVEATGVVVEGPADAKPTFADMVATYVSQRRSAVDECYLAEVLSGHTDALASFEVSIRAQPGTRRPIVRTLSSTQKDQEILGHCIREVLNDGELPRRELTTPAIKVTIREPAWLDGDSSAAAR